VTIQPMASHAGAVPSTTVLVALLVTLIPTTIAVQGKPADIGGYYQPDPAKAAAVMRPSKTFNEAIASLG
ncbi:NADP-dependent isocitrate dehydrogenase, partial [Streptomyces sp. NPDC002454]